MLQSFMLELEFTAANEKFHYSSIIEYIYSNQQIDTADDHEKTVSVSLLTMNDFFTVLVFMKLLNFSCESVSFSSARPSSLERKRCG